MGQHSKYFLKSKKNINQIVQRGIGKMKPTPEITAENILNREFQTYDELKEIISDFIDYYNNRRYQTHLNCMTPIEYRNYLENAA